MSAAPPPAPPLWRREGLILGVQPGHPWWVSHAQLPTVLPLSERLWRIYFGARNAEPRTFPLAVDVDPGAGMRVVAEHFDPLLTRGAVGAFDHFGACPASALVVGEETWLYYVGAFVRADVRGCASIGLAVSRDGLNFRRAFDGPVWGIGPHDPYFTTAPCVQADGRGYRMLYVSGTGWREVERVLDPFYTLRWTTSPDGRIWDPRSRPVLAEPLALGEAGLGRPWIAEQHGVHRLWYSRRGPAYRAAGPDAYSLVSVALGAGGEAEGPVEPVLFENPPAPGDFDSWMQAYAAVLPLGEDLVMIYNGDDFGRTGIGWARLPGGAAPAPGSAAAGA